MLARDARKNCQPRSVVAVKISLQRTMPCHDGSEPRSDSPLRRKPNGDDRAINDDGASTAERTDPAALREAHMKEACERWAARSRSMCRFFIRLMDY
jgi:hypothetical protein